MKKLIVLLLAALLLAGCGGGNREVVPEYVLTYAENQPENYPTTLGAKYFAQLVEERTEGRIIIDVVTDARMGTQQQVLDETRILVEHLDSPGSVFRMNHASNYLALRGTLNEDKEAMLAQIERAKRDTSCLRPDMWRGI